MLFLKRKRKKEEPDEGNLFTKALKDARDKGEKTFTVAGKTYDVKTEKLVGGQKKLDKDKDGDIDGKDFAMLRKAKEKKNNEEHQRYLETKRKIKMLQRFFKRYIESYKCGW